MTKKQRECIEATFRVLQDWLGLPESLLQDVIDDLDRGKKKKKVSLLIGPIGVDFSGPGAARHTDPETAKNAASLDRAWRRRQVLRGLDRIGEGTGNETADELKLDRSWVTSRLNDLAVKYDPPLARKTGRVRPGAKSRRNNEIWEVTERGKAELRDLDERGIE